MKVGTVLVVDETDLSDDFRTISFVNINNPSIFSNEVQEKCREVDALIYKGYGGEKVILCKGIEFIESR